MKKLIIPDGQYIKCTHCNQDIKDDVAMLHEGKFYCFHDFIFKMANESPVFDLGKATCLIKEM